MEVERRMGGFLKTGRQYMKCCRFPRKSGINFEIGSMMSVDRMQLPDRPVTLRVVPMPADLNQNGDVFGGWVMAQVDVAGAIPAMRRARGRVATVSVNSFQFKQAVSVGDIVSLYAEIVRIGRTSVTVRVEVFAERNYAEPVVVRVTEAELTYVAIDGDGGKRELPAE
jgi:acyl-CoA thioesterase YciA